MHAIVQATREELEADTEVVYDFQKKKKQKKTPKLASGVYLEFQNRTRVRKFSILKHKSPNQLLVY